VKNLELVSWTRIVLWRGCGKSTVVTMDGENLEHGRTVTGVG